MDIFSAMMCPELAPAINLLDEVVPKSNALDLVAFGGFYCMLLEEWCLTHHRDAAQFAIDMAQMVCAVNKAEGKYQRDTPLFESGCPNG